MGRTGERAVTERPEVLDGVAAVGVEQVVCGRHPFLATEGVRLRLVTILNPP